MSRWPSGAQYGIRAGLVLAVLLPLFFMTSRLGPGSMTITEAAPTTTTRSAPSSTTVAVAPLQLPTGTAFSAPVPTVPGGIGPLGASSLPGSETTPSTGGGNPEAGGAADQIPAPGAPAVSAPAVASQAPAAPAGQVPAPAAPGGQVPAAPAQTPTATQVQSVPAPAGVGSGGQFEGIRNQQAKFGRFADVPSAQLDINALTVSGRSDNGTAGEGQFRVACEYSHFNYDDPIVFPGQPGRAHLHMYFGNTLADAYTTDESLLNSGGSTCNGFELNRSAYWVPALLDGKGNAVVPDSIIVYYKTKAPGTAAKLPNGLKLIAGNTRAETFTANQQLHWSCGGSGASYNRTNRIPDCKGDRINATIGFPNCWDGRNLGSADLVSHVTFVDEGSSCPASHPVRIPQISILIYWPGVPSVAGWSLSSDLTSGFNSGPGATLHADWWGGWNEKAVDMWHSGCIRPARNCSFGQTGTSRQLAPLNGQQIYEGSNYLPLPPGAGPGR